MTTAYTPILKLALPQTGELSGTWGTTVNDNITSMVEQAVAGLATINTWTTNAHTLTTADGTTAESRCAMLVAADGAGGTALTGAGDIICPAASKLYVLKNGSSYAVTLKTSGGTGVAVPAGDTAFLFCDGTNVNSCVTTVVDGHISGNLTVDGNTTLGNANTDTVTVNAQFNTDLLPSTDNARDLGSTAKSWRTLYCDTSVLTPLVQVTNIKANDGTAAMSIADSTGAVTVSTILNVDNLRLDGNTISSTDSNGNITLAPNGTGDVYVDADTVRIGDSNANATLTTNGTGDLILNTNAGTNSGSITIADGADGNITIATNGAGVTEMTTAVTMSATTQNIALGTSQTSGTFTVGGAAQTGTQTIDQSTKTHTLNIGAGATESGATKTVNLATAGVSGSTTTMSVGSAVSGAITNLTVNATTTLAPVARSTGAVSYFTVTTPADTGLTASTEVIGSSFTAATRTWATGALTLQRERVFAAPTYAFAGASTLTTAVNVDIGLPVAGTNATITNAYALRADNTLFTGNVVLNNASAALDLTNLEVTNIKAKDGTASMTLADSTGVVTFSANPVLNAGTANGVPYLSSPGKVLTTGSALTFDGTTLATTGLVAAGGGAFNGNVTPTSGSSVEVTYVGGVGYITSYNRTSSAWTDLYFRAGANTIWSTSGSEQMRLTSTGLGIGTSSPAGKLTVKTGTNENLSVVTGGSGDMRLSALNDAGSATVQLSIQGSPLYFRGVGGAINATLDSSGNLGLGVTPNTWYSGTKAVEIGATTALMDISGQTNLYQNAYLNAAGFLIYKTNNFATQYRALSGQHQWFTAPSGTANSAVVAASTSYTVVALGTTTLLQWQASFNDASNNPLTVTPTLGQVLTSLSSPVSPIPNGGLVTQNISFNQAMTLDASGNLLVGTTSPTYGGQLTVRGAGATVASFMNSNFVAATSGTQLNINVGATTGNTNFQLQVNSGGGLAFNDLILQPSGGNVGIGTSSPGSRIHGAVAANGTPILTVQNTSTSQSSYGILFDTELNNAGSRNWALISEYAAVGDFHIVRSNAKDGNPFSAGTSVLALDTSGNLGLGVTPVGLDTRFKNLEIGTSTSVSDIVVSSTNLLTYLQHNSYVDAAGVTKFKAPGSNYASMYKQSGGSHSWHISTAAGTAGNPITFTQAMTLDASGNLVVGATSTSSRFEAVAGTGAQLISTFRTGDATAANNAGGGFYGISSATAATREATLWLDADGANFAGSDYFYIQKLGNSGVVNIVQYSNAAMTFYTNTAERARITSGGYFKASDDGTYINATGAYHEFRQSADDNNLYVNATNASFTSSCVIVRTTRAAGTNCNYLYGLADGVNTFVVANNGNVTNTNGTYGTISDAKMKTDIVDAGSQWSDIKALRFRKFKMKDDPSGLVQLGVVAQEVELTSPGLVDEHADKDAEGNDLGTTTKSVKTSVLLMKAAVALQEAMARIEQLEAKVAALETKGA